MDIHTQSIDPSLVQNIHEFVNQGIHRASDMKIHLNQFVKDLFKNLPSETNRRYYPSNDTIRSHIYLHVMASKHTPGDQENLEYLVSNWQTQRPAATFLFRRKGSSSLLYVHQTKNQRSLLKRYGRIVLLDATYKTCKYSLTLFFLVVKTNVDYQIVACFITEHETTESIAEALQVIRLQILYDRF